MIQLHVTYTMKPGTAPKDFLDALNDANIPEKCQHEEGNISYNYFFPADAPNQLFLLEIWENDGALAVHQQAPHFQQIPSIKEKYVDHTDLHRYETI